jgi:hypothetical protein
MYVRKGRLILIQRPYNGANRREIREHIVSKQVKVHGHEKPPGWSDSSVDFVNKLLQRKQQYRLGSDQPGIAKSHSWFDKFDWDSLNTQRMKSPFEGIVIQI